MSAVLDLASVVPVRPRALDLPAAFHATGGVMSGDHLAMLLRGCAVDQPVSRIAQWIAQRKVVNFVWQAQFMLPVFQFEPLSLHPRSRVGAVIAELRSAYDDIEIAEWFARPNEWLGDVTPAQLMEIDPAAVQRAARADRFVAAG